MRHRRANLIRLCVLFHAMMTLPPSSHTHVHCASTIGLLGLGYRRDIATIDRSKAISPTGYDSWELCRILNAIEYRTCKRFNYADYASTWLISLTYKILTISQPTYLHNLISLQTDNNTRSSDVVTLARPSPASSLKVTDRCFQYASPNLWNQLPFSLREPVSPLYAYLNPSFSSPLSPSITSSLFHSKLKTYLFGNPFPHRSRIIDT